MTSPVNRADRELTTRVDLDCRCPGTPHSSDSAQVVQLFGYGARGRIRQAGRIDGTEAFNLAMLFEGVVSWTLTLEDGKARPVSVDELGRLDEGTVNKLVEGLDPAWAQAPVPKGSGAPSRAGSRAKGSRTRKTPTPDPSTTP